MKVLLAAPKDKTVLGVVGGYCADALESLGHTVSVFDFRQMPYSRNKAIAALKSVLKPLFGSTPSPYDVPRIRATVDKQLNKSLLDHAYQYRPDVFLVLLGETITPGSVEAIKQAGAITANWLFDSIALPHRLEFMQSVALAYDNIILIDSLDVLKHVDLTAKHIESIPLGCDPDVHKRVVLTDEERRKYGSDIAFVGTVTPVREEILEKLAGLDLKIWGRWQKPNPLLAKYYQDKDIYGAEAVKVYNAAKIVIDIHGQFGVSRELFNVTPRVFEVPASGGFLLTNNIPQLRTLYNVGEEIITYDNVDSLRGLIDNYLAHDDERTMIAERGYHRAHQDHTYPQRMKTLIGSIAHA